jgi:hypothetical protein
MREIKFQANGQLRLVEAKRFVVVADLSDNSENMDELKFTAQDEAVAAVKTLHDQYRAAKLPLPVIQLVGFNINHEEIPSPVPADYNPSRQEIEEVVRERERIGNVPGSAYSPGHAENADCNAAKNIRTRGVSTVLLPSATDLLKVG